MKDNHGSQESTMALSSVNEIHPHGTGGKFGRKVTKEMVDRMRQLHSTGMSTGEMSWHLLVLESTVAGYVKDVIAVKRQKTALIRLDLPSSVRPKCCIPRSIMSVQVE